MRPRNWRDGFCVVAINTSNLINCVLPAACIVGEKESEIAHPPTRRIEKGSFPGEPSSSVDFLSPLGAHCLCSCLPYCLASPSIESIASTLHEQSLEPTKLSSVFVGKPQPIERQTKQGILPHVPSQSFSKVYCSALTFTRIVIEQT